MEGILNRTIKELTKTLPASVPGFMEQILYEIAGIKYLLVERQYTEANKNNLNNLANQHKCIWQGVKEIKQNGFLSKGFAIVKLLVPEDQVVAFNAAKY